MFKNNIEIILASESPRRRQFLEGLGLDFTVAAANVPEVHLTSELPADFVRRLAVDKAAAVGADHPGAWVIGADTAVVLENEIIGKPDDQEDALAMLSKLAGRVHEVWTGFAICRGSCEVVSRAVMTEVRFVEASRDVLASYVATGEPLDKAGAYGIQGQGGVLVERIDGSYSNVVGLPLAELVEELLRLDVIVPVPV